ncbi:hypothetical protein GCM10007079_05520 [Nocardiopsis terrae]|nr:hypothetical protein GCM10007079_05520 [Nocardiopsis terrae]
MVLPGPGSRGTGAAALRRARPRDFPPPAGGEDLPHDVALRNHTGYRSQEGVKVLRKRSGPCVRPTCHPFNRPASPYLSPKTPR